ncbi:hypothetical protein [Microvirga soli]|uniref:hypothetical protein n=1 Tax=Microvirga soli TaxID=1854496 RepID=UPI00191E41D7|nr:hypothetical protein [Microvirga soli]
MRQARKATIWIRQATALASALSLFVHIGLMALGTQPQPRIVRDSEARHLHHSDAAGGCVPSEPGKVAGHPQPCCILSFLHGLPSSPDGVRTPPRRVSAILNFGDGTGSAGIRPSPPYPVGARAPPASA